MNIGQEQFHEPRMAPIGVLIMRTYLAGQYEKVSNDRRVCIGCRVISWMWASYITIDIIKDWFV